VIVVQAASRLAQLYLIYLAIAVASALLLFVGYEFVIIIVEVVPLELEIGAIGIYVTCVWLRKPLGGPYLNFLIAMYGGYVIILPVAAAFLILKYTSFGISFAQNHLVLALVVHWLALGGVFGVGLVMLLEHIGILNTPERMRDHAIERTIEERQRRRREAERESKSDKSEPV
jgi:hypothetical protein